MQKKRFDLPNDLVGQNTITGGDRLRNLLGARAHNGRCHFRSTKRPGNGDIRNAPAEPLCDGLKIGDELKVDFQLRRLKTRIA